MGDGERVGQWLAEGDDEVVEDPEGLNEENGEGVMVEEVEEQVVTVAEDVTWPSSKGRDKRRRRQERVVIGDGNGLRDNALRETRVCQGRAGREDP